MCNWLHMKKKKDLGVLQLVLQGDLILDHTFCGTLWEKEVKMLEMLYYSLQRDC